MNYEVEELGVKSTDSYRIFFKRNVDGKKHYVSPFHDIGLYTNTRGTYRMVVEIPRWTNAKLEICKTEPFNPIKQDMKKGKLRYVDNCFPYHGYIWNYGALPQTWEMPSFSHPGIDNCKGDNDPVDVVEIGSKVHPSGSVVEVKVLGGLAMIDEGELDWKMIAIDINDPLAEKLNDLSDLKVHTPGLLKATLDWFRIYKVPAGSQPNRFAFDEQFQDREAAIEVINLAHTLWKKLISNEVDEKENNIQNFKLYNSDLNDGNFHKQTQEEAEKLVKEFSQKLIPTVSDKTLPNLQCEKVYYINKKDIIKSAQNERTKTSSEDQTGLFNQLSSFIKAQNTNILLPIALSAFVGCIIYAFYQN